MGTRGVGAGVGPSATRWGSSLDVGGGTAVLTRLAQDRRRDLVYHIVEPQKGMLRYARAYGEIHQAHAEDLPFEHGSVQMIMVGEALHHFVDPKIAFAEFARVLVPGGGLFIFEFDPSRTMGRFMATGERLLGEPGHFFTPDILAVMAREAGFLPNLKTRGWKYVLLGRRELTS